MNPETGDFLDLPPRILREVRDENDYYGASSILARQTGFNPCRPPRSAGYWVHGPTAPWQPLLHPIELDYTGRNYLPRALRRVLVSDRRSEQFLRLNGYPLASAVGAPILLASDLRSTPMPGSRLVVPSHSLPEDRGGYDRREAYEQVVETLKSGTDFALTVYCLHESEVRKGVLPDILDSLNVDWVVGASIYDMNALSRIVRLFSQFECMVTNGFGSHVLYGLWLGSCVKLVPRQSPYSSDGSQIGRWLKRHPRREELLGASPTAPNPSGAIVERWTDVLNLGPTSRDASYARQVALDSIGVDARMSPAEIADLLGWFVGSRSWLLRVAKEPDYQLRSLKRRVLRGRGRSAL